MARSDSDASMSESDRSESPAEAVRSSRPKGKPRRRTRDSDDDVQGGLSSDNESFGIPNEASSESEAEADVDDEESNPYPVEGKFKSQREKDEIMAMPEIERESILAERAEDQARLSLNRQLRLRLKAMKDRNLKRKAPDDDGDRRKTSRQRMTRDGRKEGEVNEKLEDYKRQREQKEARLQQRKRDAEERRKYSDSRRDDDDDDYDRRSMSDEDAEGEEDDEYEPADYRDDEPAPPPKVQDAPAELRDFNHIRVGRSNFAEVCFHPGFEKAITDCYARVSVGQDKATGENVYRMGHIKAFTEGRPYAMLGLNGKQFTTSQYVLVAHGVATREWPFIACSDSRITEAEFARYKSVCTADKIKMPMRSQVEIKIRDIDALIKHKFTEEELLAKIRKSGVHKTKFAVFERAAIKQRREEAIARGDEAEVAKCDAELASLTGPKLAFGTGNSSAKVAAGPNEQDRLAELNRLNRKANREDIRKAQLAEKRAEQQNLAAVARGEAVPNPFARVKTRAKVMHLVDGDSLLLPGTPGSTQELSREGTPGGISTPSGSQSQSQKVRNLAGEKKSGLPTLSKKMGEDDIIASMGIDIDIEV